MVSVYPQNQVAALHPNDRTSNKEPAFAGPLPRRESSLEQAAGAGGKAPRPILEGAFEFEPLPKHARARNSNLRQIEVELEALDWEPDSGGRASRCCGLRVASSQGNASVGHSGAPCANGFFGGVVVLNAVFIGVEVDHPSHGSEYWGLWFLADSLFLFTFMVEIALRLWSLGCRSALRDHWNVFDVVVVMLGMLDSWVLQFVMADSRGQAVRLVRLVRLLRILRVVRLFRFFRELRLLARSILEALRAMVWAALLILLALYVSAVFTTNLLGRHSGGVKKHDEVGTWFGTMLSSVFTLFQLMTLEEWPEIVRRVMVDEPLAWMFFVPFMMFMNFAMLNVVTAVVVEKVFAIAHAEAAEEARREERKRTGTLRKVKQLFDAIDKDGNALLALDEFCRALKSPAVVQQFMELGIAKYDADDLFACLDLNGDCNLSVAEFVEGCVRVHGPAQSKHLLQVQYDILRNWDDARGDLEELGRYVHWVIRHLSYLKKWWRPPAPKRISPQGKIEARVALPGAQRAEMKPATVPTQGGTASLSETEAAVAIEELREIREEQRALRDTVEGLISQVKGIREELLADPAARGPPGHE